MSTEENSMSTGIEFLDSTDLPGRGYGGVGNLDQRIVEFADALRANPGKWAKYPTQLRARTAYSYVSRINSRLGGNSIPAAFRSGEFEAAAREKTLYVRAKA